MKAFLKQTLAASAVALAASPICHAQNAGLTGPLTEVTGFLADSPLPIAKLGDLAVLGSLASALPLDSVLDIAGTSATQFYALGRPLTSPGSGTPDLEGLTAIPAGIIATLSDGNSVDPDAITGFATNGTLESVVNAVVGILDPTALLDFGSLMDLGSSFDVAALLDPAILPGVETLAPVGVLGPDYELFIPIL